MVAPAADPASLQVLRRSGTRREQRYAAGILPLVANQHFLLCTLLLCNAVAMEALPLFLDRLADPVTAIGARRSGPPPALPGSLLLWACGRRHRTRQRWRAHVHTGLVSCCRRHAAGGWTAFPPNGHAGLRLPAPSLILCALLSDICDGRARVWRDLPSSPLQQASPGPRGAARRRLIAARWQRMPMLCTVTCVWSACTHLCGSEQRCSPLLAASSACP
jgi:hypothetical protein